jgi:hypothetical protein
MAQESGKMGCKMTEFVSEIKTIPHAQERVYAVLSDLSNLSQLQDRIPADKIKVQDLAFNSDSVSFSVSPVGKISINIIEREPPKNIKFATEQSPVGANFWVQLLPDGDAQTKMKLTLRAELNPFLKPMLAKPLQEGINKIAEVLVAVPYN